MEVLLFATLFIMALFAFFMFLRLGKYTNRRRIMSYPIPEGWVETIDKTFDFSQVIKGEVRFTRVLYDRRILEK